MERLDVRALRTVKKQQNLRYLFNGAVAIAGLGTGVFFIWLGVTADVGGFLTVMSVVFGLAIAVAAVTSCWLHR